MADLSPREIKFVAGYVRTSNAEEAARQAGYSPAYARKNSYRLMRRPEIKKAVDTMRNEVRTTAKLSLVEYMDKLEEALRLATEAKQHSAAAKLLELQGKVAGLLVDRLAVEHESLDLADAVQRAVNYRAYGSVVAPRVIDTTHREVAPDTGTDPMS